MLSHSPSEEADVGVWMMLVGLAMMALLLLGGIWLLVLRWLGRE
jgi:hypothetical protein